ncbi:minor tail protein [Microbacterium phage Burro]|uniref:Minor tail protein n=1 Tax=Microbacterium phage Burro TaxID=2315703 RepID=A0A386KLE1_9CAUD|nr:minor tail protein [Microbacterium phage Burro]AYD86176.1 minor tail protein [Microbacterium phage Burro]
MVVTVSNSPREATVIEAEVRKSLSFNVWIQDANKTTIDTTGATLSLTAAKVDKYGTEQIVLSSFATMVTSGNFRFDLQASELNLKIGEYPMVATLTSDGYSAALFKGTLRIVENFEVMSITQNYLISPSSSALLIQLGNQNSIHVELSTLLPSDVVRVPPGGTTGQVLVKKSGGDWDLAWGTLSGGLSAAGQAVGRVPRANGNGTWSWSVPQWNDINAKPIAWDPIPFRTFAATAFDYPMGYTTFFNNIVTDPSGGWPGQYGTVQTVRSYSGAGGTIQYWSGYNTLPGQVFMRQWPYLATAWTAWKRIDGLYVDEQVATRTTPAQVTTQIQTTAANVNVSSDLSRTGAGTLASPYVVGLPDRLGQNGATITDWNSITSPGFYGGNSAANAPVAGQVFGVVEDNGTQLVATVHDPSDLMNTEYRRIYSGGAWGAWVRRRNGAWEGSTTARNALVPKYWEFWWDTTLNQMFVGSTTGTWRQYSGFAQDTAKAWDTTQTNLAGRTITFTLPTVLETTEYVSVYAVSAGSGFGFIGGTFLIRNPTNTSLGVRFMQIMSLTTQALLISWNIVPG